MLIPKYQNIFSNIGTNFEKVFYVKDKNNLPIDLSNYSVTASFTNSLLPSSSINSTFVISTNLTATITNPLTGEITISASAADTSSYKFGRYLYKINVTHNSTNISTRVFEGILTVNP